MFRATLTNISYFLSFSNMYVKQYNQYSEYCNEEEKVDGHKHHADWG